MSILIRIQTSHIRTNIIHFPLHDCSSDSDTTVIHLIPEQLPSVIGLCCPSRIYLYNLFYYELTGSYRKCQFLRKL
jgi:hypothetical protein